MPEQRAINISNKGKLITRIVIWSILGILLILAGYEFYVKQMAVKTGEAWNKQFSEKKDAEEELDFEALVAAKGSPTVTEEKIGTNGQEKTYTWKGVFRKYEIKVQIREPINDKKLGTGKFEEATVETLEGVGITADDEE